MAFDAVVCVKKSMLNLCYALQNLCLLSICHLSVAKISHSVLCNNQKCLTS